MILEEEFLFVGRLRDLMVLVIYLDWGWDIYIRVFFEYKEVMC